MNTDNGKDKHCDYNNFKRARYFHGMLMTDRDFREEQIYHNEKRKLHNRLLHGWGVVCGLGIKAACPTSSKIIITPGMALDCCGNEILVCEDFEVDLKKPSDLCPDTSGKGSDLCAERPNEKDRECKYYVGIKYTEVPSDPEAVYAPGGGCEDKACDYTRTREGFCVKLFKSPPCHDLLPEKGVIEKLVDCVKGDRNYEEIFTCFKNGFESFHNLFCEETYPCPACCCDGDPYVVLGTIDFRETNCKVTTIDSDMISIQEGRRYVLTFMFWQYYLGSLYHPIAEFLENPFRDICKTLSYIVDLLAEIGFKREDLVDQKSMVYMSKVTGQNEYDAKETLRADKLNYRRTVSLAPYNAMEIIGRVADIKGFEPEMRVDLITDKQGKALFFIPAPKPSEEEAVFKLKVDELETTVAGYPDRMDPLETKIKKLDALETKIKKLGALETKVKKLDALETKIKKLDVLEKDMKRLDDLAKMEKRLTELEKKI